MKMFHNHVVKLKCKRQCVSITTNCHKWRIAQSKVVKLVTKKCIFAKLVFPKILHQLNVEFWYTPRRPISDASRTWKNIPSWWVNCSKTFKSVRNGAEAKTLGAVWIEVERRRTAFCLLRWVIWMKELRYCKSIDKYWILTLLLRQITGHSEQPNVQQQQRHPQNNHFTFTGKVFLKTLLILSIVSLNSSGATLETRPLGNSVLNRLLKPNLKTNYKQTHLFRCCIAYTVILPAPRIITGSLTIVTPTSPDISSSSS